jgi:glycosyltransferase involved in cell wall biosynthesis
MVSSSQKKLRVLFVYSTLSTFVRDDLRTLNVTTFLVPRRNEYLIAYFRLLKGILWADVVYSWWANLNSVFTVLFSAVLRKKSIVVVGGYEVAYVPEIHYGTLLSIKGRVEVKFIMRHASKILAVSESSKKEILRFVKPKTLKLVYNGIDVEKFKPLNTKENLVITVGGISHVAIKKKRFDVFVEASKNLAVGQFVLIGIFLDGSIQQLKSKAASNVKFTGYVPEETLLQYYQKAKVYCQLSTQESFGVALAEAMACGCVPVVTRKYSLPEIVGDTGFYVPYNNPEVTADAIRQALASKKGLKARARIEKCFSLKAREKKLIREISDLSEQK